MAAEPGLPAFCRDSPVQSELQQAPEHCHHTSCLQVNWRPEVLHNAHEQAIGQGDLRPRMHARPHHAALAGRHSGQDVHTLQVNLPI